METNSSRENASPLFEWKRKIRQTLFCQRIKTGRKWLSHLPATYHDELIATLFCDIDRDRAELVCKTFLNKNLRLSAEDSSTLKSYVGLNDQQYIRLMRGFHYFVGLRLVSPMKAIVLLRNQRVTNEYTTLRSTLVDMTRKARNGKREITRLIKVVVSTIRPAE